MKPAPFAYYAPRTVADAAATLTDLGDGGSVLAGGQSLVRLMNTRVRNPAALVDINRVDGLDYIRLDDGVLRIGATTRQQASVSSPVVASAAPLLSEAGAQVAHEPVRRWGTVVGSIAFADPAAELPAALLALDGEVVARSARGERRIPATDFYLDAFVTALAPDEVATEIRVPVTRGRVGSSWHELARRHGDIPVGGVGAVIELDAGGTVTRARIALCSLHRHQVRATTAERALVGTRGEPAAIAEAADVVNRDIEPYHDIHGGPAYRRRLAAVLTRRSLSVAVDRASAGGTDD